VYVKILARKQIFFKMKKAFVCPTGWGVGANCPTGSSTNCVGRIKYTTRTRRKWMLP